MQLLLIDKKFFYNLWRMPNTAIYNIFDSCNYHITLGFCSRLSSIWINRVFIVSMYNIHCICMYPNRFLCEEGFLTSFMLETARWQINVHKLCVLPPQFRYRETPNSVDSNSAVPGLVRFQKSTALSIFPDLVRFLKKINCRVSKLSQNPLVLK